MERKIYVLIVRFKYLHGAVDECPHVAVQILTWSCGCKSSRCGSNTYIERWMYVLTLRFKYLHGAMDVCPHIVLQILTWCGNCMS